MPEYTICGGKHGDLKGGIFECAIADALYKNGYSLYFYKNETTKRELDFIIQKEGKVIPIEVKSGNTRATSLKSFIKNKDDVEFGYKFIDGNIGVNDEGIITLPLYMATFVWGCRYFVRCLSYEKDRQGY